MRWFTAVILLLINIDAFAQQPLIPFRAGKMWGFADTGLVVRINPQYEGALPFEYGYGVVFKNNKAGLVDKNGKLVVPMRYNWFEFVYDKEVKYVKPRTENLKSGLYALPKGKLLLDTVYTDLYVIKKSLFVAHTKENNMGLFDAAKEKWVAQPIYDNILEVAEKGVRVIKDVDEYFISYDGNIQQQQSLPPAMLPLEEVVATDAEIGEAKPTEFVKAKDSVLIPQYDMKLPELFQENGKWGFRFMMNFKNDLQNNSIPKPALPDIIPPVYDSINAGYTFFKKIAAKKDGKWGIINSKNKVLIPFQYDGFDLWRSSYVDDIYTVKANGKMSLVDKNGNWLAQNMDDIKRRDGFFVLRSGGFYGALILASHQRPFLIVPKYVSIGEDLINVRFLNNRYYPLLHVSTENGYGYISLRGEEYFKD